MSKTMNDNVLSPKNIKLNMLVFLGGYDNGDYSEDGTLGGSQYSKVKSISKSGKKVTLTNGEVYSLFTCEDINGTGFWASGESLVRFVKKVEKAKKLSDDNHRYLELAPLDGGSVGAGQEVSDATKLALVETNAYTQPCARCNVCKPAYKFVRGICQSCTDKAPAFEAVAPTNEHILEAINLRGELIKVKEELAAEKRTSGALRDITTGPLQSLNDELIKVKAELAEYKAKKCDISLVEAHQTNLLVIKKLREELSAERLKANTAKKELSAEREKLLIQKSKVVVIGDSMSEQARAYQVKLEKAQAEVVEANAEVNEYSAANGVYTLQVWNLETELAALKASHADTVKRHNETIAYNTEIQAEKREALEKVSKLEAEVADDLRLNKAMTKERDDALASAAFEKKHLKAARAFSCDTVRAHDALAEKLHASEKSVKSFSSALELSEDKHQRLCEASGKQSEEVKVLTGVVLKYQAIYTANAKTIQAQADAIAKLTPEAIEPTSEKMVHDILAGLGAL